MLYNLLSPYTGHLHLANLFHYITFRSAVAALLSFMICLGISPKLIRYLRSIQRNGQPISGYLTSHATKIGTPTMGGVIIIMSVTISCFLLIDLNNPYVWIVFLVFIGLGILGFIDDYAKISNNRNIGLSASSKFWLQGLISVSVCVAVSSLSPSEYVNKLALPFFKNVLVDLGYFYIPFATIVVVGSSNAVNLTDGLDGLAIVPIGMVAACFMVISYVAGSAFYANYLQIIYVPDIAELSVFCASLIGASLGFLWFNSQPAEIFMGDTGSLSLGGVLGIISVISKHEIVLSIVGGLFVIETLSVIIQVYYFKVSKGRRIFYMAPLHHHFEKKGWSESRVVVRFWIISAIFALMGLSSLKLR